MSPIVNAPIRPPRPFSYVNSNLDSAISWSTLHASNYLLYCMWKVLMDGGHGLMHRLDDHE